MVNTVLTAIETAVPIITNLMAFVQKARTTLLQSKELDADGRARLDKAIADLKDAPKPWQKVQPL